MYVVTDVGEEGFNSSSVKVNQRGLSKKIHPEKFLLPYQLRLNIHSFFIINFEHRFSIAPLCGYDLGNWLSNLLFLKTIDEVLQTLKILVHVLTFSTSIDDVSWIGTIFYHVIFCLDLFLKFSYVFLKRFLMMTWLTLQFLNLKVDFSHVKLLLLFEILEEGNNFFDVFADGIFLELAIFDFSSLLPVLFQFTIYTFCPLLPLFGQYLAQSLHFWCHQQLAQEELSLFVHLGLLIEFGEVWLCENGMQVFVKEGVPDKQGQGGCPHRLATQCALSHEWFEVVNAPNFIQLNLFKVVGVDVMPKLAEEDVVGVIVGVGLLVGNLEVETELGQKGKEGIAATIA